MTLGFDVFVQLVIAATTTAPCSSRADATDVATAGACPHRRPVDRGHRRACRLAPSCRSSSSGSDAWNPASRSVSDTRSCGPFRSGQARLDQRQIELDRFVVRAHRCAASRKSPCSFAYSSTSLTCAGARPSSVR